LHPHSSTVVLLRDERALKAYIGQGLPELLGVLFILLMLVPVAGPELIGDFP